MGGVVGVVNGLVITRLKVVPFIATLGMLWHRTRRREVVGQSTDRQHAGDMVERAAGHVSESGVAAGRPRSVDHNRPRCARGDRFASNGIWTPRLCARFERGRGAACGIATDRLKIWIYGLAGLLFGLAGVMQMSRLRQGDPTVAAGSELDIIAAVVIGGGSLNGGEGSILGSMIGALIMAFLRNGCQQVGWPNYVQEIIIGMIIVVAVAVDRWRTRS